MTLLSPHCCWKQNHALSRSWSASVGVLPIWTNEFLLAKQKHSLPSYRCFVGTKANSCRSQWSRGLRRRATAAHLLRLWVRIPPRAWMFVCCDCCVLSSRGLRDELITRPEVSYRLWRVVVCDLETSRMRSWPALGRSAQGKKTNSKRKEQTASWKAPFLSGSHKIPHISAVPNVHYLICKSPPLLPVLSHISPVCVLPSYLFKNHFNIIPKPTSRCFKWPHIFWFLHQNTV